jgi:hypothetical protein
LNLTEAALETVSAGEVVLLNNQDYLRRQVDAILASQIRMKENSFNKLKREERDLWLILGELNIITT